MPQISVTQHLQKWTALPTALLISTALALPFYAPLNAHASDDQESAPAATADEPAAGDDAEKPYGVQCATAEDGTQSCTVDRKTFVGWRTYHAFCHVCHAQDAVGSTFAPSLVDRMKVIDKERFLDAVANGYTGQIGVMPPWKDNPNISKRYEELYAYLKARSDGALPGGRPEVARDSGQ